VGSLVAALTATTIRTSVLRSRAAALALASRRRGGSDPAPAESAAVEHVDPLPSPTPWSGWVRGGVTVAAGFALGIAGLLLVQLGIGRNLTPGTDQLQSAAARVVAAGPSTRSSTPSAPPTATTTVTKTAPATPSATASHSTDPVKPPTGSPTPSASSTPSAAPTPSGGVFTP